MSSFGSVRELASGRYQARYFHKGREYKGPMTYRLKSQATKWLATVETDMARGTWLSPLKAETQSKTLREYFATWLPGRKLSPKTREQYAKMAERHIMPRLGDLPLIAIEPQMIRDWYGSMNPNTPTTRAKSYGLLHVILATVVEDEVLAANPCKIKKGSAVTVAKTIKVLSQNEVATLANLMPERYRAMAMVAAYTCVRFGELTELRRSDLEDGVLRVRRGVTRCLDATTGEYAFVVGPPKTPAGERDIPLPEFLRPMLAAHILAYAGPGSDGLIFPAVSGGHLLNTRMSRVFGRARKLIGRPTFAWHDLRHTGGVLWAQQGATLAELMELLGHETPAMAMRYQHVAEGRLATLSEKVNQAYLESKIVRAV